MVTTAGCSIKMMSRCVVDTRTAVHDINFPTRDDDGVDLEVVELELLVWMLVVAAAWVVRSSGSENKCMGRASL